MREQVEPTVTERTQDHDRYVTTHPSFGVIGASRVSGHANLFGSNVGHSGYVVIRIGHGEMHGSGFSEHVYSPASPLIEVALSEAQWAGFVSRMNISWGVPCTLQHMRLDGKYQEMPAIASQMKADEKLESQAEQMADASELRAKDYTKKLLELLETKLSGKALFEAKTMLDCVLNHGKSTREFHKKCLTETKEKLVVEAKLEFEAMLNSTVRELGLEHLRGQMPQLLITKDDGQ